MNSLPLLLTLWQSGIVSDAEVQAWLNDKLAGSDTPSEVLLDLVFHGPATCLRWAEHVFPVRPIALGYLDEFALRSLTLDLNAEADVGSFVSWAIGGCAYEDRQDRFVAYAYELLAMCMEACDVWPGVEHVQANLTSFRPQLLARARALTDAVPGLAPSLLLEELAGGEPDARIAGTP